MSDRNVADLHPMLQVWYLLLVADLKAQNYDARMIEGWRDPAYQQHLVDTRVTTVCPAKDFHCVVINGRPASKAFDLGIFDDHGDYCANGGHPGYAAAGALWERYAGLLGAPPGMVWGGRFVHPKPDPDHFQIG